MISPERMEEMAFDELYAECKKLHTELKFKVEYIQELNEVIKQYTERLAPFEDEYFKGLDTKQIAELAKKSIRLTTENRKLECALDETGTHIKHIETYAANIDMMYDAFHGSELPKVRKSITENYFSIRKTIDEILDIISKAKGGK